MVAGEASPVDSAIRKLPFENARSAEELFADLEDVIDSERFAGEDVKEELRARRIRMNRGVRLEQNDDAGVAVLFCLSLFGGDVGAIQHAHSESRDEGREELANQPRRIERGRAVGNRGAQREVLPIGGCGDVGDHDEDQRTDPAGEGIRGNTDSDDAEARFTDFLRDSEEWGRLFGWIMPDSGIRGGVKFGVCRHRAYRPGLAATIRDPFATYCLKKLPVSDGNR